MLILKTQTNLNLIIIINFKKHSKKMSTEIYEVLVYFELI